MLDIGNASGRLTNWQSLCREISALGFEPPPGEPSGVALAMPMAGIAANDGRSAAFFRRLGTALSVQGGICLRVTDPGAGADAIRNWQSCCEHIRTFTDLRGIDSSRLSFCMPLT